MIKFTGTKYIVRYSYVDHTYWDDGSRVDTAEKSFDDVEDALRWIKEAKESGIHKTSPMTGKADVFTFFSEPDIYVMTVTKLDKAWTEVTNSAPAVPNFGRSRGS